MTTSHDCFRGGPWTHFWDMHSGGGQKLPWAHIFIEAPEGEAKRLFAEAFSRDPDNESCGCCGGDYSISEEPTLAQASAYQRHLPYVSTLVGGKGWRTATDEERRHANQVGRYLEPDEPLPDGWESEENTGVRLGYDKPMSFADFLDDPHFDDLGRRREVKILARPSGDIDGDVR